MSSIRQFIHFIPVKDSNQPCLVAISRQYSKELAEKQAFLDFQDKQGMVQFERMCTRELTVDEEGLIRLVEEEGIIVK